ncbi:MAG: hypothetical protein JNK64_24810 [Myxococcales bacterium]|nr:hypothetical protein [Myxococcales bacterium]
MRVFVGLIVPAVAIALAPARTEAWAIPTEPWILVPRAALPDPTVLVVGPGELGTDRAPDITTYVDGDEVPRTMARRRIGGRWVWAVHIPARSGNVIVRRRGRDGADVDVKRFPIVARVAPPVLDASLRPTVLGDDVVMQWSTVDPDGRAITVDVHPGDGPGSVSGQEAFRANGEIVRFAIPSAPSAPPVVARPHAARRWLVLGGLIATALVLVARRRRPRVAI